MCVIIYTPNKSQFKIDDAEIINAVMVNPDGNGLVIVSPSGAVDVSKGLTAAEVTDRIRTAHKGSAVMLHSRIATSGGINKAMMHPFTSPSGRIILAHNGIVSTDGLAGDAKQSDTAKLAQRMDDYHKQPKTMHRLAAQNTSKFWVLDRENGNAVTLYGRWILNNGIYRSNENHLGIRKPASNAHHWMPSGKGSQPAKPSQPAQNVPRRDIAINTNPYKWEEVRIGFGFTLAEWYGMPLAERQECADIFDLTN